MTRADKLLRERPRGFAGRRINWASIVAYGLNFLVLVIIGTIAWCMHTGAIQP